jgi:hypothetical protein
MCEYVWRADQITVLQTSPESERFGVQSNPVQLERLGLVYCG